MVGGDDLDLMAQDEAGVLGRHDGRLERALAARIGIDRRHVVEHADLDRALGRPGNAADDKKAHCGDEATDSMRHLTIPGLCRDLAVTIAAAAAHWCGRSS